MAKPRSRVSHRAEAQVRRDALLHSRSRWLYYRSWAKQSGRCLRLNRRGERITDIEFAHADVRCWSNRRLFQHNPGSGPAAPTRYVVCIEPLQIERPGLSVAQADRIRWI